METKAVLINGYVRPFYSKRLS